MKGRPPKPTQLRVLDGNAGKRALHTGEPDPPAIFHAPPPAQLTDARAIALWTDLVPQLGRWVGLSELDLVGLELLCAAYGRMHAALDKLKELNSTTYETKGRNGLQHKTRPQLLHVHAEHALIKSLMAEFGLSPAARVRLKGIAQGDLFDDPLAKLASKYGAASGEAQDAGAS